VSGKQGRNRLLLPGLVMTVVGIVSGVIAMRTAIPQLTSPTGGDAPVALFVLAIAALLFSVGFMMLIVAVTRPFFERRDIDDVAASLKERREKHSH
jgi:hypothetical protein